jgi:EmrB/QacA subfamily drug resistance transporter
VIVALPTILRELAFSENSLVWVINAYLIPYGGFLMLFGRLADYRGRRGVFLVGAMLFTASSLLCGIAWSRELLTIARAAQGAAGAAVSAVSVSSIVQDFEDLSERARAMAIFSSLQAAAASGGFLLGGVLVHLLNWRWIFLVNLPIGVVVCVLSKVLPSNKRRQDSPLDVGGAVSITTSMLLVIYSALNASTAGWLSPFTLIPILCSLVSFSLFLMIETRARNPLVPLTLFRYPNLRVSVIAGSLWIGALSIWDFISSLYLQRSLGYDALKLGLSFLPATVIVGLFSLGLSTKLVLRFGCRALLVIGMIIVAAGLMLFSRIPASATYAVDVLPGMLLVGFGSGMASSPFYLSGLGDVKEGDYGIASAVLNSSTMLGGAIALAAVAGRRITQNPPLPTIHGHASLFPTSYGPAFAIAAFLAASAALVNAYINDHREPPAPSA